MSFLKKKSAIAVFATTLLAGVLVFNFQNCESGFKAQEVESSLNSALKTSCSLPDGTTVAPGDFVEGYSLVSAFFPTTCGNRVKRTCLSSGSFDGAVPVYAACTQLCAHPDNNQPINAGFTYVSYTKANGISQADCDNAKVSSLCNRDTGLFTPTPPTQRFSSCLVPGQTCAYTSTTGTATPSGNTTGATVTGYILPSATFPTTCGAQVTRTCQAGGQWTGGVPVYTACLQRCQHPDTNQPVDANFKYVFFTRPSGTSTECLAARIESTCQQSDGTFTPVVPTTRYTNCSVATAPAISVFTANVNPVTQGQSVILSWTQVGATSLILNPGNQTVTSQNQITVSPTTTTTYTLVATNAAGSVNRTLTVTVNPTSASSLYPIDVTKTTSPPAGSVPVRLTVFRSGLSTPWGMTFMPDGRLLVTQKGGSLVIVSRDGQNVSSPLTGVPAVDSGGQGGLLDVALDPQFASNRRIYLTYAERGEGGSGAAIARAELNSAETGLTNVLVIFRQTKKSGSSNHYGSRLAFRNDGTLFVTVGERFNFADEAQSLNSNMGKVLRLNTDGSAAANNPFLMQGGIAATVWTYGHRNIQAATVHPTTGDLWVSEHGPQGGDEINLSLPGRNFGWPQVSYGCSYGDPVGTNCRYGGGVHASPFIPPLVYWFPVSTAPGGIAFYNGSRISEWQGNLFVGGLADKTLWRFILDGTRVVAHQALFVGQHEIRDVRMGPDGYLYLISRSTNQILRVERQ